MITAGLSMISCGGMPIEKDQESIESLDESLYLGAPSANVTVWTDNNNVVPVCWATPGFATDKANIQNAVATTWAPSTSLSFNWTAACPTSGSTRYLKIALSQGGNTGVTGSSAVGMLNTYRLPSEGAAMNIALPLQGTNPGGVAYVGAHEMGHALGMEHEQDRFENAGGALCNDTVGAMFPDRVPLTVYDQNSIMNYCGPRTAALTYLDRLGISEVYGRAALGVVHVRLGSLYHRVRTTTGPSTGTWTTAASVESVAGEIGTIVEADMRSTHIGTTHVAAVTSDGGLYYTRRALNGTWTSFIDVKSLAGNPGSVTRVALAEDSSLLGPSGYNAMHMAALTSDGHIWHSIRSDAGSWTPLSDIELQTGDAGTFVDASIVMTGNVQAGQETLQFCGATSDGNIWHSVRQHSGVWTAMSSIESVTGGDRGSFVDVDCAATADHLHFVGVTSTGDVYHAIRTPGGTWTSMWNVSANVPGLSGTINAVAASQQKGQLNVVLKNTNGTLFYGVRPDATWSPFVTMPSCFSPALCAAQSVAAD
jgi:hypothetical protein